MGHIYIITNDINDKIYVGQTVTTVLNRWYHHLDAYLRENWHLYRAMRKYGVEHFHIQEIEQCSESLLDDRETYWIKYYNSYHNGYNMTLGGEGRIGLDRSTIADKWKHGESTLQIANELNCWSSSVIDVLKELQLYDKEEVKRRKMIDIANIQSESKVIQYNEQGEVVNIFNSTQEAASKTGIHPKNIKNALTSYVGAGGYLWRYEKDGKPQPRKVKTCSSKEVQQIDPHTHELIKVFKSATQAGKELKIDPSGIIKVCKGKRKTAGGFIWHYNLEEEK